MDWRFRQDGTIEVAVGATGVIETKATTQQNAAAHAMNPTGMNALAEYGQFVADNTGGVSHEHFFSYRLDNDVQAPRNNLLAESNDPTRYPTEPRAKPLFSV